MTGRLLKFTTLLLLLTGCRKEQLSLPVTHAATAVRQEQVELPRTSVTRGPQPGSSCFAFIPLRPRNQRADAVQERLKQADEMAAALDSHTVTVDLVGDHANVLSLEFPVRWPAPPFYAQRVSSIVEHYFSATQVQDDLCNAGFAAVKLSLRSLKDRRIHPIWTARVTSEGLLKQGSDEAEAVTPQGQ